MRFSTFSTGFSTTKGHQPYTHRNSGRSFLVSFGQKCGHSAFYKKESRRIFFAFYKPFPSGDLFFSNLEWLAPSFQHRAAAVFLCGKGGETCSFPHRKKLLLAGAPGANSPSLAALDRFPFLSLRDIFPRPGEVVLWDGAFGSTEKFPAKVQSLRHARGSLFEGAGKTVRF